MRLQRESVQQRFPNSIVDYRTPTRHDYTIRSSMESSFVKNTIIKLRKLIYIIRDRTNQKDYGIVHV